MSNAVHGKSCVIYANGFDISNYLQTFSASRQAQELESTTFQDTARTYVPDLAEGTANLEGFFSHDEVNLNTAEDFFKVALTASTNQVITIGPEGAATLGLRAILQDAVETSHSIKSPVRGLVSTVAAFRGGLAHGVFLAPKASYTTTGNGTSVDGVAASTSGGVAHLHVFAKSGTTPTLDAKVQHSSDNSTFADLITFTQATGITSQRVAVTGTVNRYTRAARTVGGTSPNFTFAISFARF